MALVSQGKNVSYEHCLPYVLVKFKTMDAVSSVKFTNVCTHVLMLSDIFNP